MRIVRLFIIAICGIILSGCVATIDRSMLREHMVEKEKIDHGNVEIITECSFSPVTKSAKKTYFTESTCVFMRDRLNIYYQKNELTSIERQANVLYTEMKGVAHAKYGLSRQLQVEGSLSDIVIFPSTKDGFSDQKLSEKLYKYLLSKGVKRNDPRGFILLDVDMIVVPIII